MAAPEKKMKNETSTPLKRILLFCEAAYSFAILRPIEREALRRGCTVDWYMPPGLLGSFSGAADKRCFTSISELAAIPYDAIFVPGNTVPYYLRGVKVQVFHGFAGEKVGHFKIRHYFDLYLTQGPHFTQRFQEFQQKFRDFEVAETGWPKLDAYFDGSINLTTLKQKYRQDDLPVILYAPTFSRSLTSAKLLLPEFERLGQTGKYRIVVKFHPLMDKPMIALYQSTFRDSKFVSIEAQDDLTPLILLADLMVSDTSSAIYENIIIGKPAITLNTKTPQPRWRDITDPALLPAAIDEVFSESGRDLSAISNAYHPYRDGQSARRMVDAVESYIQKFGVPSSRKLGFFRRFQINRKYGKPG